MKNRVPFVRDKFNELKISIQKNIISRWILKLAPCVILKNISKIFPKIIQNVQIVLYKIGVKCYNDKKGKISIQQEIKKCILKKNGHKLLQKQF